MKTKLLLTFILSLLLIGCGQEKEVEGYSDVVFSIPESSSVKTVQALSQNPEIHTLADINCFSIVVSWEEKLEGFKEGSCETVNTDGVYSKVVAKQVFGPIKRGEEIMITVPYGEKRRFAIIGVNTNLQECPSLTNVDQFVMDNTSSPLVVGTARKDIIEEVEFVDMQISTTGAKEIVECAGGPFEWEGTQEYTESGGTDSSN